MVDHELVVLDGERALNRALDVERGADLAADRAAL
jgi:hypothetical protein